MNKAARNRTECPKRNLRNTREKEKEAVYNRDNEDSNLNTDLYQKLLFTNSIGNIHSNANLNPRKGVDTSRSVDDVQLCQVDDPKDADSSVSVRSPNLRESHAECDNDHDDVSDRPDPRDHGYAWVVVLLSVFVVFIVYSTWAGFGVYLTEFAQQYPESKAYFALLFSIQNVATGITGMFGGTFIELCSPRAAAILGVLAIAIGFFVGSFSTDFYLLALSYGIIIGVGNSLSLMSATVATQQYFNKKRGIANGLIHAGGSSAFFVMSPVIAYITDNFGWRTSFIMQSGLALQAVAAAMLLRPLPKTKQNLNTKDPFLRKLTKNIVKSCQFKVLRIPAFSVLAIGAFFFHFAHETPYVFIVARAMSHGIARQQASFVMSSLAATSIPSRVLIGWVGDKTHRGVLISVAVLVAGATNVISILCRSLTSHLVYAAVYGFFAGGFIALISPTIVDVVGLEFLSASQGVYMLIFGIAGLGGPILSNFLVELTNDYEASYVMAGAVCLAGGVMIAISAVLNHYLKKRNCDNTPVLPPGDGESNHLTRTEARRKHLEAISLQSLGR